MEFFHRVTQFPFMRTRRRWYAVSAVLVLISLVSLFTRGLHLGTDFTGGVNLQVQFAAAADVERLRGALTAAGIAEAQVATFGSVRDVEVRLPPVDPKDVGALEREREQVLAALQSVDASALLLQTEAVGAQVGVELRTAAWQSLLATMILIGLYVAARFHTWRLSVGAVVAAMHDPILVIGFFSVSGLTFDLPTVAAILAVIGYSLNDTVVVFDRIRERFHAARKLPPHEVLDQSINQTLSRTIITSGATLLVVLVLLVLGGPVLLGFSTALTVGIVVGTYSSIYIAGATALDLGLNADHLLPTAVKQPVDQLP